MTDRTGRDWFEMAKLDPDELEKKRKDKEEALKGSSSGREVSPLKGDTLPTNPAGFPVGEIRLMKDKDGEVVVPPGIDPMRVTAMKDYGEPEKRSYLVNGLIPDGACTSLFGDGGVAKSLIALDLCCSVARGQDLWMGREVTGCAALYLDFELSADEQVRRARALCNGSSFEGVPDELLYMSALGHSSQDAFFNAYRVAIEEGIGLLVVDSFGLALHGEAESATDIIGFYKRYLAPFVDEGIAVVIIDHQSKGPDSYQRKTSFGSVYKRNLVRSEIQVEALEQDEDTGTLDLVFRHTKHNFGPRLRPFGAQVSFRDDAIYLGPIELDARRMLLEEGMRPADRVLLAMSDLSEPVTAKEIADHAEMNLKTVRNQITNLKRRGKVRATGERRGANRMDVVELIEASPGPVAYLPNNGASEF